MDTTQPRFAHTLNLDYQHHQNPTPSFSNPWPSSSSQTHHGPSGSMYVGSQPQSNLNHGLMAGKTQTGRSGTNNSHPITSYGSLPVTSSSGLMGISRMPPVSGPYGDGPYASSSSSVGGQFATSGPSYDGMGYAPAPVRPHQFSLVPEEERKYHPPSLQQQQADERRGFADALDASRGMLAMSQETPRPIYGSRTDRSSIDSYGFPSTHSTSSSISSSGNFSSYYGDSVSDYSTAGSDIESVNSRTLPRPHMMNSQMPPAPQSMMGQFSSKVSSSTQKKHKCKICDKRFTRPSSLQTHMYSHTGEKPFACEVEGCGRHFSVVSNLRRHRKVHRGDAPSEAGSEDIQSD